MKNIDSSFSHLVNSLPMLLYSNLQYSPSHQYSKEELVKIKEKKIEKLEIDYLNDLSELKEKYDNYFFSNNFKRDEYNLIKEDIEKKELLIDNLDISGIEDIDTSVPVNFLISNEANEKPGLETSDMVFKGSLEKLDEWILIQFHVENNILNTEDLIYKSVTSTNNLVDLIPEISSSLKTIILGRAWSSLVFDLYPNDSNIVVKNNLGMTVSSEFEYLYPGIYNIDISKPGYISKTISIELKELQTLVIDTKLEMKKQSIISLQSFPSGADLYSGATWIGKTPVLIKNLLNPTFLTIKLEGYNDRKYIFNETSEHDIKVYLQSSFIDYDRITSRKRNIFYKSFSYFLVSIPLSMISFGISSDYAYAYDREISYSSETDRLKLLSNTWYNVYLGAVFINITLFINTIFDLVDYIKSSDNL
ncbi:MAG: hypothetical protein KAQ93_00090 [Spirochaetales bacterium]|nr:hypothetical protein [Spirochaetales bacterium]